jgi:three-Cys-motif partner protein
VGVKALAGMQARQSDASLRAWTAAAEAGRAWPKATVVAARREALRAMTAKQRPYTEGSDGLPTRQVGPWVERKAHYVDYYAGMFATGMHRKWPRRAYVELFAGTGLSWDYGHCREIEGSALRALRRDFTDYVFVDIDEAAMVALAARLERHPQPEHRRLTLLSEDCNDAVGRVRAAIDGAITLVFVDPTNWQIRLDSIARLVDGRAVDLLFTFHHGAMRRVGNAPALDAFFGTDRWHPLLSLPHHMVAGALVQLYNSQLEKLGYLDTHELVIPVRNRQNVVMYDLVVFTRDERGIDFWRKSLRAPDEAGQRSLWDL